MPTENERKYVIKTSCEVEVNELCYEKYQIGQGYLIATRGITVRIRKMKPLFGKEKEVYYYTMKVNAGGRMIEIEDKIDKRDFDDLWNISVNKLEKIRYIVKEQKAYWEIDFFKDYRNETYMAVAEIEMPEGQIEPDSLPSVVKDNLIYKVDLTDNRFANKLLGDARYACEILKELQEK